jgi:hypothetical protein
MTPFRMVRGNNSVDDLSRGNRQAALGKTPFETGSHVPPARLNDTPMQMRVLISPIVAALLGASCQYQPPTSHTAPTTHPMMAPATEPSPPNSVARLNAAYPYLEPLLLEYRNAEGDAHRSSRFATLAGALDQTCFGPPAWVYTFGQLRVSGPTSRSASAVHATRLEVLSFLGLPDCGTTDGRNAVYVYHYWRPETHSQRVAMVEIKDGLLDCVGWNDASVNNFSTLKQYRKWSDVLAAVNGKESHGRSSTGETETVTHFSSTVVVVVTTQQPSVGL